jgi:hypothetical protein
MADTFQKFLFFPGVDIPFDHVETYNSYKERISDNRKAKVAVRVCLFAGMDRRWGAVWESSNTKLGCLPTMANPEGNLAALILMAVRKPTVYLQDELFRFLVHQKDSCFGEEMECLDGKQIIKDVSQLFSDKVSVYGESQDIINDLMAAGSIFYFPLIRFSGADVSGYYDMSAVSSTYPCDDLYCE